MKKTSGFNDLAESFYSPFVQSLENIPEYVLVSDTKGNLIITNSKLRNLLSFNRSEIGNFHLEDIFTFDRKELTKKETPKFLKKINKSDNRISLILKTKNKKKIPVECFGNDFRCKNEDFHLLIAIDASGKQKLKSELKKIKSDLNKTLSKYPELKLWSITQKKEPLELVDKSIKALKKSQKNYKKILENITEGYFELNLDGNIIFVNRGLCRISGFSKQELIGKNYMEIFEQTEAKKIREVINQGLIEDTYEFELKKKDESKIIIESSLVLKKEEGKKIGYFGMVRDITPRKRAERLKNKFREELKFKVKDRTKKLKEALDSQKKLMDEVLRASQFKSDFLASFSHELRTPLNAITGFTELLLEQAYGELTNEQSDFLTDIKDSSNHLLDLINNILDISRIESGKIEIRKENFEIKSFLRKIKSAFTPKFSNKNLSFEIEKGVDIQKIETDPIRLKQILFNLLSNAYKFTFTGKVILMVNENDKHWKFIVKDTGIGIDEKDKNIIFKEFKRVNSKRVNKIPGSGLGLALTKRLIDLLGGEISFESQLGKGSTFKVYLPKTE